jgi:hypothetical protein
MHRAALLAPEGVRRRIRHGDDFFGVDNLDGKMLVVDAAKFLPNRRFISGKDYANIELPSGKNRSFHFRPWGVVAPHRIQSNRNHFRPQKLRHNDAGSVAIAREIRPTQMLYSSLYGPYRNRTSGTPGAEVSFPCSSGIRREKTWKDGRARDGCWYGASSDVALD